jgi:hypothetical protein
MASLSGAGLSGAGLYVAGRPVIADLVLIDLALSSNLGTFRQNAQLLQLTMAASPPCH